VWYPILSVNGPPFKSTRRINVNLSTVNNPLYCHMCGRRMSGNTMKSHRYYACAPKKAWRSQEHPTIFRVREDSLLDALEEFLSARIFGAYRHNLLDANLQTLNDTSRRDHATHVKALQSSIADTKIKSKNLLRSIEVADNSDLQKFQEFVREVNERRAELKAECADYEQRLAEAEDEARQAPNPDLLHHLPIGPVDLTDLPDKLTRRLFEALRLEIRYNHNTHTATYRVTLIGDALDTISQTAHQTNIISCKTPTSVTTSENDSAERTNPALPPVDGLRSAPGRIRTCDLWVMSSPRTVSPVSHGRIWAGRWHRHRWSPSRLSWRAGSSRVSLPHRLPRWSAYSPALASH
jgi:site-specific DNA recombinase